MATIKIGNVTFGKHFISIKNSAGVVKKARAHSWVSTFIGRDGKGTRKGVSVYAKDYGKEFNEIIAMGNLGPVKNDTDIMTDYFEHSRIYFYEDTNPKEFGILSSMIACNWK